MNQTTPPSFNLISTTTVPPFKNHNNNPRRARRRDENWRIVKYEIDFPAILHRTAATW